MSDPACPVCGSTYDSWQKLRHHHQSEHGSPLPNRTCSTCGNDFFSKTEKKYCSEECREQGLRQSITGETNPNYRGGKTTTTCDICGTEFSYYPSEKEGCYCPTCVEERDWQDPPEQPTGSDHHSWTGGKATFECDVCGDTFERHPGNVEGEATLCSDECQREWLSEAFTGEGHPNWEGGDTGPYGKGWSRVRRQALERDGHECVVCGTTKEELGRNPDVHHVVPVRAFRESPEHEVEHAHSLANVVSLCVDCHRKADVGELSRERLRRLGADAAD